MQLDPTPIVSESNRKLTSSEVAELLNILANEYNTTMPAVLKKLDSVSGSLRMLERVFEGDNTLEWTKREDAMLETHIDILRRWKGNEAVELRKKYLQHKVKRGSWFMYPLMKVCIKNLSKFTASKVS